MDPNSQVKVIVLGSGTSSGIPIIGCSCVVCNSTNLKNKRLRSSCYIEVDGKSLLIDTSPDLRQQALTYGIRRLNAILYTHDHADHIHGIDDLRPFNFINGGSLPAYGHPSVMERLVNKFRYIFDANTKYPSYLPQLRAMPVEGLFDCVDIPVQMIPCEHGPQKTYNYRIGSMAWLTDTNGISESSMELLQNLDVLFLDALRKKPHPTHFHLEQSLEVIQKLKPKKTYLIHLNDDYDHDEFNKTLPEGVELAYDGLTVCL